MTMPSFIVVGAAKCGTTSICELMSKHPNVFMTKPKEPHYFSRLATFEQRRKWYVSLFDGSEPFSARGEGSTSYTHPHRIEFVVSRIREFIPECRIIYMVRNPIKRLESDWKMRLYERRSFQSINEAVEEEASLITFGLYWKHLSLYRSFFPDEQILVLFLEDLSKAPHLQLARAFRHIGVDPSFVPKEDLTQPRNSSKDFRKYDWFAKRINYLARFGRMKELVPRSMQRAARNLLTSEFKPVVEWDKAILDEVVGHFSEDSSRLLEFCGKSMDYWDLGKERNSTS